ncbi:MAG: 6-phosphogluconolactonase [Sedimentisphaerales bacterium]|nr:6-phosphogluconolactonase [Sedimentisphaerales bacterium]
MRTLNNDKLKLMSVNDSAQLAQKALELFLDAASRAIESKGVFYVAISGGKTPLHFFQLIGKEDRSLSLEWDKVELFWVDERCVKPDSADSNYGLAASTFLNKVPIPPKNIHRIGGECEDYNLAVEEYTNTLKEVFGLGPGHFPEFDLMILGMGPDGHIGSLLPNSYALFDTDDLVTVVYQMEGGLNRITLTHPVMCAAQQLIVMVSGEEKAHIVHKVLLGGPDEVKYPVHTLWPILDKVTWLVDKQAAKLL